MLFLARLATASVFLGLTALTADAAFTVVPPGNATTAGNAIYGLTLPLTSQTIYGANLLAAVPTGSVINGISFRLASTLPTGPTTALTATNFDIRLGTSTFAPGSLSSTFAANEGADTVLARTGPLTIPANSFPGGASPNGFGPEITFTKPYIYNGGDLLLTLSYTSLFPPGLILDAQTGLNAEEIQGNGYNTTTASNTANGYALIAQFDYAPAAVPEPGSLLLCGVAGAVGLGYTRARRRFGRLG